MVAASLALDLTVTVALDLLVQDVVAFLEVALMEAEFEQSLGVGALMKVEFEQGPNVRALMETEFEQSLGVVALMEIDFE